MAEMIKCYESRFRCAECSSESGAMFLWTLESGEPTFSQTAFDLSVCIEQHRFVLNGFDVTHEIHIHRESPVETKRPTEPATGAQWKVNQVDDEGVMGKYCCTHY